MKYVFLANPTVGHTNFLISLALQTKAAGNDVVFMLPGIKSKILRNALDNPSLNIHEKLEKLSIPHKLIPISLTQGMLSTLLPSKRALKEVLYALKVFSAGTHKYSNYLINEFS